MSARSWLPMSLLLVLGLAEVALADEWVGWQWVNPSPQGRDLNAIAHLPEAGAVAVGDSGTILVLADGAWQMTLTGKEYDLLDVTTDGEMIVAVGGTFVTALGNWPQDGFILTSQDGMTWTERCRTVDDGVPFAVVHDGGKFVAIGFRFLATSTDGIQWERHTPAGELHDAPVVSLAWSGSRFVAAPVPDGNFLWGKRAILISDDGLDWREVPLPEDILKSASDQVVWGNGHFVIPGRRGVITSADGVEWSTSPEIFPSSSFLRLFFIRGVFIALGFGWYSGSTWVGYSVDGLAWTVLDVAGELDQPMNGVDWVGDHYEGVGQEGLMATSEDGIRWSQTSTNDVVVAGLLNDLVTSGDGSTMVAVGDLNTVATSQDGLHWVAQQLPSPDPVDFFYQASWINGAFWVGSTYGWIWRSADGATWELARDVLNGPFSVYDIAGNAEVLVAVGLDWDFMSPVVLTSPDGGATWWSQTFNFAGNWLHDITWWGGQFIALGRYGLLMNSEDGTEWTIREMDGIRDFNGIAQSPTRAVVLATTTDRASQLLITEDGLSFEVTTPPVEPLRDITWTGSHFVAVGWNGIITSRDGLRWTGEDLGLGWLPVCVAGRGTELYVAGFHGGILRAHNVAAEPRRPGGRLP